MDWTITPIDLIIVCAVIISAIVSNYGIAIIKQGQSVLAAKFDNGIDKRLGQLEQGQEAQRVRCAAYIDQHHSPMGSHDTNVNLSSGPGNVAGEGHIGTSGGQKTEIGGSS